MTAPCCCDHVTHDDNGDMRAVFCPTHDRRFYEVDFGIDYTICARDEDHVLEILRTADGDFAETYWVTDGPLIKEIPRAEVEKRTYLEDGRDRVPLLTLQLGEFCSSEY